MLKSLTEDTGVSSWSRKGTLMSDTLLRSCLVPKKMSLVLLGFISYWCEQHHPAMRRKSSVIFTRQERVHVFSRKGAVDLRIIHVGVGTAALNCGG